MLGTFRGWTTGKLSVGMTGKKVTLLHSTGVVETCSTGYCHQIVWVLSGPKIAPVGRQRKNFGLLGIVSLRHLPPVTVAFLGLAPRCGVHGFDLDRTKDDGMDLSGRAVIMHHVNLGGGKHRVAGLTTLWHQGGSPQSLCKGPSAQLHKHRKPRSALNPADPARKKVHGRHRGAFQRRRRRRLNPSKFFRPLLTPPLDEGLNRHRGALGRSSAWPQRE